MKKSTLALVIMTVVSLALSVVMGVIAVFVLAGEAKQAAKEIDFAAEFNKVRSWFDDSGSDSDGDAKVRISASGVHVETDDGKTVDVGYDGIKID